MQTRLKSCLPRIRLVWKNYPWQNSHVYLGSTRVLKKKMFYNINTVFTPLHFLCNLRMAPISWISPDWNGLPDTQFRNLRRRSVLNKNPMYVHLFFYPSPSFRGVKKFLPDGESNPGLPRDRRGYWPLYYRGLDVKSGIFVFHYWLIISH